MRKLTVLLVILALVVAAVPTVTAQDVEVNSVCLVTDIGRVNDGTFNQYAYDGMVAAVDDFDLDSTFIETIAQTDYDANIESCVSEGFDIIVTVGFLITDATVAAAEANPDVFFIGVDQFIVDGPSNMVGIQFREDQAGFLVGALAALVSESDVVAGVYGVDVPPVVKFRHGYEQGVRLINVLFDREVETLGVYIDNFVAPDRGASAALQFIGDGADVVFGAGGQTGSGGIRAAAQEGVYVIGVDQDEYYTTFGSGETEGVEYLISSAMKRVDVGVYNMIQALVEGGADFPGGGLYILSVENEGIEAAGPNDAELDACYYEFIDALTEALVNGDIETGVEPGLGEILAEVDADFVGDFTLEFTCE